MPLNAPVFSDIAVLGGGGQFFSFLSNATRKNKSRNLRNWLAQKYQEGYTFLDLLIGFILRPKTVPRNSHANMKSTGVFTLNAISSNQIEGRQILEYLGVVAGSIVKSRNAGSDIFAGLKSIVGGELVGYSKLLQRAREDAYQSKEQAEKQIIPNDLFKGILSKESREIDPILFESVSFLLKISKRITKINKIPANLAPLK